MGDGLNCMTPHRMANPAGWLTMVWLAGSCLTGCAPAPVRTPPIAASVPPAAAIDGPLHAPPATGNLVNPVPLPLRPIAMPQAGQLTSYGLTVTPDLATAFAAWAAHEPDRALMALERAESTEDLATLWQVSFLRGLVLIMAGRAADAEAESLVTARREDAWLGHDLNAVALRGEARLALGDPDAEDAFADVARRTAEWRLPVTYRAPPSNLAEIVALTTAQLRAFAGLARLAFRRGHYRLAMDWAEAAEDRFNDIHRLASDKTYGAFVPVHLDSYLERARNLVLRGAARLASGRRRGPAEADITQATRFFETVGSTHDRLIAAGQHGRALLAAELPEAALGVVESAAVDADVSRNIDMIWRLEGLRGESLLALDRLAEAAEAFQRAQLAANESSGPVAADRVPDRLQVSKDDLGYRVDRLAIRNQALADAFTAMELARAQALHDSLATVPLAGGSEAAVVDEVRRVDQARHLQRLLRIGIGSTVTEDQRTTLELDDLRRELAGRLAERASWLHVLLTRDMPALADVQRRLDPDETLLYGLAARGAEAVRWLRITPDGADLIASEISASDLALLLDGFWTALRRADIDGQASLARRLSTALASRDLTAAARTFVVPTPETAAVPWGALDIAGPVVLAPSAREWMAGVPEAAPGPAVVVGYPMVAGGYPDRPGSNEETATVAARFGITPLTAETATAAALRDRLGAGTDVLHLSGHTACRSDRPLAAALLLRSEDGKSAPLTAGRLFETPLPARLVTLASCWPGRPSPARDAALWSLVRALRFGGARWVLLSVWPTEPQTSQAFTELFYRRALTGDMPAAWFEARTLLLNKNAPPAVHGAYVLVGGTANPIGPTDGG